VQKAWDDIRGKTAAKAAGEASEVSAASQEEALQYLRETEALPQELRESALSQLGSIYGLPGFGAGEEGAVPGAGREEFIAGLRTDPFYSELVGAGEEAVLRGASATGGLRSGSTSENLARVNQDVLRGLYQERVGGLTGLANLPSYAPQIAGGIAGVGQTLASGITAAGQARQSGIGQVAGLGLQAAKLFI